MLNRQQSISKLPPEDVVKSFDTLSLHLPTEFEEIFDYFEDHYIGRIRAGSRAQPRFEISMWNCYDRTRSNEPRTNNAVEGWNSNFVKLVNTKHPSLPKIIANFMDEQKNAEILVEKLIAGQPVQLVKKKKYEQIDANLQQIVDKYKQMPLQDYLRGCSYNIKL